MARRNVASLRRQYAEAKRAYHVIGDALYREAHGGRSARHKKKARHRRGR